MGNFFCGGGGYNFKLTAMEIQLYSTYLTFITIGCYTIFIYNLHNRDALNHH